MIFNKKNKSPEADSAELNKPQPEENPQLEREIRRRRAKNGRVMKTLDRVFGFMLATVLVIGVAGLSLVYIFERGPSKSLTELFVHTMTETRRFDFMANLFLTEDEVTELNSVSGGAGSIGDFDSSLIKISSADGSSDGQADYVQAEDEDGDGIIFEDIKQNGFVGYLITVLDPKRVLVGSPDVIGGSGLTLEQMVNKYDALGGINAGGFNDEGGTGSGGLPEGLTILNGEVVSRSNAVSMFVGFDADGLMYVGYYDDWSAAQQGILNGASFGPILIMNGEPLSIIDSGVNPRTAIGQRADGAVLMLVIDGRQVHSMGAPYSDLQRIMLEHGAVNAINLDGGSSTCMYYNGEYVNKCSGSSGPRALSTAFLFK